MRAFKRNRIFVILCLLALLVGANSFTSNTLCKSYSNCNSTDTTLNYLVIYGKYVFDRENCIHCHSLDLANSNNRVSLDGIGGKYSSGRLVLTIEEPKFLYPTTTMPSFLHLNKKRIERETFNTILQKLKVNNVVGDEDRLWNQLETQADSFIRDIHKEQPPIYKRSELIALVAYLQDIPSSKEKLRRDSVFYEQVKREKLIWDKLVSDSTSVIYRQLAYKANIEKGGRIFKGNCVPCHGLDGKGGIAPDLTDSNWIHGGNASDIAKTIVYGVVEKGMRSWYSDLRPSEVGQVIAYIYSQQKKRTKKIGR